MPEEYIFYDAEGYRWVWLPAENRVVIDDDDPDNRKNPEGGYPAFSLEQAIKTLTEYGYIRRNRHAK